MTPPNDEGEGGPDPEVVREMLEDALVLLGDANAHLIMWRQRLFSDYLMIWKEGLCARAYQQIRICSHASSMGKIKSEHDHKASTSKLICKPKTGP